MEDFKSKVENLTDNIGQYVNTYYKLSVLNATDKATGIAATSLATLSIFFLGIFVLFFTGMALGIWLGDILENPVAGYLIVAGFYLLIIIILVLLRKRIVFPFIRNLIIRKIYE